MRKIVIFSWICVCASFGFALWSWLNLPNLEQYPVHWGANGLPDRYGTKSEVMFTLFMIPTVTAFIFLIFMFLPKIEPVRVNVEANTRPYHYVWVLILLLMTGVSGLIANSYAHLETLSANTKLSLSILTIGLSLFFIFMGNIMGKFRRNFLIGIRTPWTLTSDLSWDKTHRLVGRLFVLSGVVGLATSFVMPIEIALYFLIGMSTAAALFAFVYSFFIWKNDPNKKT
jgi:uncharacterized membrane protein